MASILKDYKLVNRYSEHEDEYEEEFDQYKFEEAWIKGESDNEGFFTLTHMKSKKVLTAISAQILKVMGKFLKILTSSF